MEKGEANESVHTDCVQLSASACVLSGLLRVVNRGQPQSSVVEGVIQFAHNVAVQGIIFWTEQRCRSVGRIAAVALMDGSRRLRNNEAEWDIGILYPGWEALVLDIWSTWLSLNQT